MKLQKKEFTTFPPIICRKLFFHCIKKISQVAANIFKENVPATVPTQLPPGFTCIVKLELPASKEKMDSDALRKRGSYNLRLRDLCYMENSHCLSKASLRIFHMPLTNPSDVSYTPFPEPHRNPFSLWKRPLNQFHFTSQLSTPYSSSNAPV